eukprot:4733228-Amphidinium_carterae.1
MVQQRGQQNRHCFEQAFACRGDPQDTLSIALWPLQAQLAQQRCGVPARRWHGLHGAAHPCPQVEFVHLRW